MAEIHSLIHGPGSELGDKLKATKEERVLEIKKGDKRIGGGFVTVQNKLRNVHFDLTFSTDLPRKDVRKILKSIHGHNFLKTVRAESISLPKDITDTHKSMKKLLRKEGFELQELGEKEFFVKKIRRRG